MAENTVLYDYTVPQGIVFSSPYDNGSIQTTALTIMPDGRLSVLSEKFVYAFISKYKTFQVQHRERGRYLPSYWEHDHADDTESEHWSDWGAWVDIGGSVSGNTASPVVMAGTNERFTVARISAQYDVSTYDRAEMEVRVRAFDEVSSPHRVSEWAYERLDVLFDPSIELTDVTRNTDGSITLEVSTNWERGGKLVFGRIFDGVNGNEVAEYKEPHEFTGTEFEATIPPGIIPDGYSELAADMMRIATADNNGHLKSWIEFEPTGGGGEIAEPRIAVIDAGGGDVFVRVKPEGGIDGFACSVVATWNDVRGSRGSEVPQVEARSEDGSFIAVLRTLPFGARISLRIGMSEEGSAWKSFMREFSSPRYGNVVLSDGGERVEISWNPSRSYSYTQDGEAVELADGTSVSRYGASDMREISGGGTLLNGDGAWLPDIEMLTAKHDWWYRTPAGDRWRVMVKSWNVAKDVRNASASVNYALRRVD